MNKTKIIIALVLAVPLACWLLLRKHKSTPAEAEEDKNETPYNQLGL